MERTAPVLVGRDAELGRLVDALTAAERGDGRVVVVEGEAGIGKTRLLGELRSRIPEIAPGAVVATGQGVELSGGVVPYGVAAGLLQNLVVAAGAGAVRDTDRGPDLHELVPSLVAAAGHEQPFDRLSLYSTVHQLLAALSQDGLVVLVVEDLQWADSGSLDLLGYVVAAGAGARLLVVVTVRPLASLAPEPAGLVTLLTRQSGAELVSLAALDEDDARQHVSQVAGGALEEATVRAILDRAEGVPLYLEEIAVEAATAGEGAVRVVPTTLQLAVTGRLASLTTSDRSVLDAASVHEGPFAVDLLARVTELDPADVSVATDAAAALGIFDELASDRYRFHHALQRHAVEQVLPARQRARWHRAWALALASGHDRDHLSERARAELVTAEAHHWRAADEAPQALASSFTAASVASRLDSPREAAFQLGQCLDLWTRVDDPEAVVGRTREDLLQSLVDAQRTGGDHEATLLLLDREEAGPWSASTLATAWIDVERRYADFLLGTGAVPELAHDEVGVVLDLVRDEPASALLLDLLSRLWWDQEVGRFEYAERLAQRIDSVAAHVEGAMAPRAVLSRAVDRAIWHDDWEGVQRLCRAAIGEGLVGTELLGAEVFLVMALTYLGYPAEAVTVGERALRRIPHRDAAGESWDDLRLALADAHELLGHYGAARDHLTQIATIAPPGVVAGAALAHLARLELALGDSNRATQLAEESRGALPPLGARNASTAWTFGPVLFDAMACARAGRPEQAMAHLRAILSAPDVLDDPQLVWRCVLEASRLLPSADPVTCELVRDVAAGLPRIGRFGQAWSAEVTAWLARYDGTDDPDLWRAAVAAWTEIPAPAHRSVASVGLAEALLRAGDRDRARDTLEQALATADEISDVGLAATVRTAAGRARIRLPGDGGRRPASSVALTPREHDVLELLAEGCTNDQIGRALFMSPRTASVHVSRILTKLGVANRTEAAAKAGREGLLSPGT